MSDATKKVNQIEANADSAPQYLVPRTHLIGVEHPFFIKNVNRAVTSLGGSKALAGLVDPNGEDVPARLSLRPEDRFARTIESAIVPGHNLLLKIEVPKRTGRKRKRGSNRPFSTAEELTAVGHKATAETTTSIAVRALKDNIDKCSISVVGDITRTHRFRDAPDFVWRPQPDGFFSRFKSELLSGSYEKIRDFSLESNPPNPELLPPPSMLTAITHWNYSYRQNAAVKAVEVDGKQVMMNLSKPNKLKVVSLTADEFVEAPNPSKEVLDQDFAGLHPQDKRLVEIARELFRQRPIWTRRSIRVALHAHKVNTTYMDHRIFAHVAYSIRTGAWRDTLIRYGVNPTHDTHFRWYQTINIRSNETGDVGNKVRKGPREYGSSMSTGSYTELIRPGPSRSHIFDGASIDTSSKLWQLCDLTDPQLRQLLSTPNLRPEADLVHGGWYHSGTWGKIVALMRAKIRHLVAYGQPLDGDAGYVRRLLQIPDQITRADFDRMGAKRMVLGSKERGQIDAQREMMRAMLGKELTQVLGPETEDVRETAQPEHSLRYEELAGEVDEQTRDIINDLEEEAEGENDHDDVDDDEEENEDEAHVEFEEDEEADDGQNDDDESGSQDGDNASGDEEEEDEEDYEDYYDEVNPAGKADDSAQTIKGQD